MVLDHWFWFQLRRFFMIRLRVVGVFYDKSFNAGGISNIKDLLDVAVRDAGMVAPIGGGSPLSKFTYTSTIRNKLGAGGVNEAVYSLLGFTHYLTNDIQPSLGAKQRLAGYYKLFESTSIERDSVTVHAWQYYVIRRAQRNVVSNFWEGDVNEPDVSPATPPTGTPFKPGFTPFDQMPIQDGDEVVWRNVSIVRNPQTEPIF
jgi:hypothetical protein